LGSHSTNLDKNYDYGFRFALAAMARPGVAIRSVGVAALFTALAMKCPMVHTTATDTLIAVIHDGRLTPDMAVQPIRDLLALDLLTHRRWRSSRSSPTATHGWFRICSKQSLPIYRPKNPPVFSNCCTKPPLPQAARSAPNP